MLLHLERCRKSVTSVKEQVAARGVLERGLGGTLEDGARLWGASCGQPRNPQGTWNPLVYPTASVVGALPGDESG